MAWNTPIFEPSVKLKRLAELIGCASYYSHWSASGSYPDGAMARNRCARQGRPKFIRRRLWIHDAASQGTARAPAVSTLRFALSTKVLVDSFSKRCQGLPTKVLIVRNPAMPKKKKTLTLTNAEHRIMEVIWARRSATVAEVVEALNGNDAYTTILTLMRILKEKGYLSTRKEGRAFIFAPKVDRDTAARKAVHQLLAKFFAGSPSELVLSFLREEELTSAELEVIRQRIQESGDGRDEK
jgi:BlaI family penicillinase repressor